MLPWRRPEIRMADLLAQGVLLLSAHLGKTAAWHKRNAWEARRCRLHHRMARLHGLVRSKVRHPYSGSSISASGSTG